MMLQIHATDSLTGDDKRPTSTTWPGAGEPSGHTLVCSWPLVRALISASCPLKEDFRCSLVVLPRAFSDADGDDDGGRGGDDEEDDIAEVIVACPLPCHCRHKVVGQGKKRVSGCPVRKPILLN